MYWSWLWRSLHSVYMIQFTIRAAWVSYKGVRSRPFERSANKLNNFIHTWRTCLLRFLTVKGLCLYRLPSGFPGYLRLAGTVTWSKNNVWASSRKCLNMSKVNVLRGFRWDSGWGNEEYKNRQKCHSELLEILKSEYRHENALLVHYNELAG